MLPFPTLMLTYIHTILHSYAIINTLIHAYTHHTLPFPTYILFLHTYIHTYIPRQRAIPRQSLVKHSSNSEATIESRDGSAIECHGFIHILAHSSHPPLAADTLTYPPTGMAPNARRVEVGHRFLGALISISPAFSLQFILQLVQVNLSQRRGSKRAAVSCC